MYGAGLHAGKMKRDMFSAFPRTPKQHSFLFNRFTHSCLSCMYSVETVTSE